MSRNTRHSSIESGSEELAGEVFRVSYTSLIILLLAFFVFLFSLTTPDAIRSSNVRESLDHQFELAAMQKRQEDANAITDLAKAANFKVEKQSEQMLITMPGSSVFESGSDVVLPQMLPPLSKIADLVNSLDLSVVIEGHTDDRPIQSARFPSNWELSAARATSVLRHFLEHGVPSEHLAAAGRGEFFPVASNDSEEGRAQNRRVTLLIKSARAGEGKPD